MSDNYFEGVEWDGDGKYIFPNPSPGAPVVALKLRCGTVIIREGTGRDIVKAGKIAGGDPDKVMPALMHLLCTIDGAQLPADDFLDLSMSDFARIQAELNELVSGGN